MAYKKEIGAIFKRNGVSFRVWAPFAEKVAVKGHFSDWQPIEMASEGDGYWHTVVKGAQEGQEYNFEIHNNGQVYNRNDPRALHFTTSSGNSVLDLDEFDWEDDDFTPPPFNEQVIYELHVGTFNRKDPALTGTFDDVTAKLDHLQSLGINMIELMPISSMLMDRGWGYAIDYIFSIESLYGGRHEFLNLVKEAHKRGIGVIVDVVYNHFGPDQSLDLWQFDGWNQDGKGGIYFYNDWRAETPWGNTRPDYGRPEVRQYLLDNVTMWLNDCHVDGLRVDSTIYIRNAHGQNNNPSTDIPEAWYFLQKLNNLAKKVKPASIVIAEDIAYNDYITKDTHIGGAGFDAQWELGVPRAMREALNDSNINLAAICGELTKQYNNDAFQKIVFIDSHDSAANGSSRFNEDLYPGQATNTMARKKSLIAASLLFTMPGIPMVFQGQEFVEDGSFNDWRGLDWDKLDKFYGVALAFKHLIELRRNLHQNSKGLTGQNINISHLDENNQVLAYNRWHTGGPKDSIVVITNFLKTPHSEYNLGFPRNGLWKLRFNSAWEGYIPENKPFEVHDAVVTNGTGTISLPPLSTLIYSQDH